MFSTGHSALIGTLIAPLMLLGGPLVLRAAAITGGVVGALSLTAACAPDGKFLTWGGPLAIGLGGVFMACLGKSLSGEEVLEMHNYMKLKMKTLPEKKKKKISLQKGKREKKELEELRDFIICTCMWIKSQNDNVLTLFS